MDVHALAARLLTARLRKFRNAHAGEACYIFGDGPSIKWVNFADLPKLPAITCGMIPFHRDFDQLDARYVTQVEPRLFLPSVFQQPQVRKLRTIATEFKRYILRTKDKQFFLSLTNWPAIRGKNINYVFHRFPDITSRTDRLLEGVNLFEGSFYATLTLAYYLGFTQAFLVGFDAWTIHPARTSRWYEFGEGELFEATNYATEFLGVLKEKMGITVIAPNGVSKNLNFVRYDDYVGKHPRYRENHELMDRRMLEVMSTYREYKIFDSYGEAGKASHFSR